MSLPLPRRLRETAIAIQREQAIHLGNLRRLLSEAADELDRRRGDGVPAEPAPGPEPLDATGVAFRQGRGKISIRPKGEIRMVVRGERR